MRYDTPSHEELQAIVGRALVDPEFCRDLLNGHRRERLAEFRLSHEEREAAAAVEATDLAGFARQIDRWIKDQPAAASSRWPEPAGLMRAWRFAGGV